MAYRPIKSRPAHWTVTNNIIVPALAWGIPLLVAGIAGFVSGIFFGLDWAIGLSLFGIIITAAILTATGILIVPQTEWRVAERFSTFHSIKFPGFSFMLWKGVIDTFAEHGDLRPFKIPLFVGEEGKREELDFTDDSAPISAEVWLCIGDPNLDPKKDRKLLSEQIRRFVYTAGDPKLLARSIVEDRLRPLLQQLSVDRAQKEGHEAADPAITQAKASLAALGIYPREPQAIMISDISLSEETKARRAKRLEGETTAQQEAAEAMGPLKAILAIQQGSKGPDGIGPGMTLEEAQEIYFRSETLQTIRGAGANFSFVSPDMNGVIRMVDVGKKG